MYFLALGKSVNQRHVMEVGLSKVHNQPTWCLSGEDANALCVCLALFH